MLFSEWDGLFCSFFGFIVCCVVVVVVVVVVVDVNTMSSKTM